MKARMRQRNGISIACLLWLWAAGAPAQVEAPKEAAPESTAGELVRIAKDDAGSPVSLQTSIVRFRPGAGSAQPSSLEVSLVSAVHIAEQSYYAELNRRFRDYDAVLYELIAPADTRVPLGGGEQKSLLSNVQMALTNTLSLAFQLNEIDYTQPNLIHADLSPDEIAASMAARGESLADYFWRALAVSLSQSAKQPSGAQSAGLLMLLLSPDRERLVKVQLATSMLDMDTVTAIFEGPNGSTLIGERNKRAVSILQERIRRGDRRIAIFYGAGHMDDMAMRLTSELGLERADTVWLDAWDLR